MVAEPDPCLADRTCHNISQIGHYPGDLVVGLHQPAFVSARRQRLFYPLSENTTRQPAYSETVVQSYNAGVKNQLARLGTAALELVFPSRCVGCGEYGSFLCSACESSLPRLKHPTARTARSRIQVLCSVADVCRTRYLLTRSARPI